MTEPAINLTTVIVAALASLPPTLVGAATLWQAWKTHKSVNSRMTELLEVTRDDATGKATLAEKASAARVTSQKVAPVKYRPIKRAPAKK